MFVKQSLNLIFWRSRCVVYTFDEEAERDLKNMHKNILRQLQTSCLIVSSNWRKIAIYFTLEIIFLTCFASCLLRRLLDHQRLSQVSTFIQKLSEITFLVGNEWNSDFDKILLKIMIDKQNMYVQGLGSRAVENFECTRVCSKKEVDILILERSLTVAKPTCIHCEDNSADSKFAVNKDKREKGSWFCVVVKDATMKSRVVLVSSNSKRDWNSW